MAAEPTLAPPPPVAPVSVGEPRPLWSVMIPTFNCAVYLREALGSVLAQDPGPAAMQIEVVDDCSTKDDPAAVVREVGRGRVAFYRQSANGGAISNFNTCIARSRGHLVHILHGDDFVLRGFYPAVAAAATRESDVAAFFVRCFGVNEDSSLEWMSARVRTLENSGRTPGDLLYHNQLMTPGVVVRRSFYEQCGGFLPGLPHVADWEMWVRAITQSGGSAINEPLAAYRFFANNDTSRLARTAENLRDYLRLGNRWSQTQPDFDPVRFRRNVAVLARQQSFRFDALGQAEAALANEQLYRELTALTDRLITRLISALNRWT